MPTGSITQDRPRAVKMAAGILLLGLCLLAVIHETLSPTIFNLAFPGVALLIAGWLYISHPPLYLGFIWWIWFITPFIRRLSDYQAGSHTSMNPVMLTPLLVTGLTFFTFLRFGKRLQKRLYFPFLLPLLGVGYGYLIGIIRVGVLPATYDLLQWILPVLFGFHVLLFWRLYPDHRRVVTTTFSWGVLLMGSYGIVQYIVGPAWDMKWLLESGMHSLGDPYPMQFRVFSTLNDTGTFANIMMTGLLLLFSGQGVISRIAVAPGYISFLLSLVRSAWGAWFVGLVYIGARFTGQSRVRLIGLMIVSFALCIPLYLFTPTDRVSERAETITNLDDDTSFRGRMGVYQTKGVRSFLYPVGQGIGAFGKAGKLSEAGETIVFDAGILEVPTTLGWLGTFLYLGGLIWILWSIIQIKKQETDRFAVTAVAVAMAYVAMLPFGNSLNGLPGIVAWSFMGLALAAKRYYA